MRNRTLAVSALAIPAALLMGCAASEPTPSASIEPAPAKPSYLTYAAGDALGRQIRVNDVYLAEFGRANPFAPDAPTYGDPALAAPTTAVASETIPDDELDAGH